MESPPLIGFLSPAERQAYLSDWFDGFKSNQPPKIESWSERRKALGHEVCKRKLIYLDTNFWVNFRKVLEGNSNDHKDSALLYRLRELVGAGVALCPLSDATFVELMRQPEPRRTATAQVMDELSQGVCIQEHQQRIRAEIRDFMDRARKNTLLHTRHPRDEVWTKCGYAVGDVVPQVDEIPPTLLAIMQRGFDDLLCSYRVEELVGMLAAAPANSPLFKLDAHHKQNQDKEIHFNEVRSFEQVFQGEMQNALELFVDDIARAFCDHSGLSENQLRDVGPSPVNKLINLMTTSLSNNPNLDILPTLRVAASIHATHWLDGPRKYKDHDAEDIMHAEAALPYCDFFFTEKSLASMVCSSPAKIAQFFGTVVCNNAGEALTALENL